jgi:hypothetical protein
MICGLNPQFFHAFSARFAHYFHTQFFKYFPARFPHDLADSAGDKNGENQACPRSLRKNRDSIRRSRTSQRFPL